MISSPALANDQPNPIDEPHSRLPQGLPQVTEFQMRVRVDESRKQSDVAKINRFAFNRLANTYDPVAFDYDNAIFDRRQIHRKHDARSKRKRHSPSVAAFKRCRPPRVG